MATGIFYPDVGGPAIHVRKIAEALGQAGFKPVVVTYGDTLIPDQFNFRVRRASRRLLKLIRWLVYFYLVLTEGFGAKIIYAFDLSAAGLPAFLTAAIWRKKFVIRIGGDPIWERVVEHGKRFISLQDYYDQGLYLQDRPGLYRWIRYLVGHSDRIVVYNEMFKDFYTRYFGAKPNSILVVPNPVYVRGPAKAELGADSLIIFAGRFVAYKNLPLVIRAFEQVRDKLGRARLLLIGHGPDRQQLEEQIAKSRFSQAITIEASVPQEKLFQLINESAMAIGPALSEFNPNFILESLSFGKPVLLSSGHGLSVTLPPEFLFDPKNELELVERLLWLLDPNHYPLAVQTIASLPREQTWEKVTQSHVRLIQELLQKS